MDAKTCAKCGSDQIIKDAHVTEFGHLNTRHRANVTIYRNPNAMFFKEAVHQPLEAEVCKMCGYTELYVRNPRSLR